MKQCRKCQEFKILDEFTKDKSTEDGKSNRCKTCNREKCKSYFDRNKEKFKEYAYKSRYRLNVQGFMQLKEKQGGACAICK